MIKSVCARYRLFYCIVSLTCLTISRFAGAETGILHTPPANGRVGNDLVLRISLEPAGTRAIFIQLYYRQAGQNSYTQCMFSPQGNEWVAHIPGKDLTEDGLEYFISALLDNDTVSTFPQFNPYEDPVSLTILPAPAESMKKPPSPATQQHVPMQPEASGSEAILILSPEDHSEMPVDDVLFAAAFADSNAVDPSSVQLFLDGQQVTGQAEMSMFLLTYTPTRLNPGNHWFKLLAKTPDGSPLSHSSFQHFRHKHKRTRFIDVQRLYLRRSAPGKHQRTG